MDIDEFLDRELADMGLSEKPENRPHGDSSSGESSEIFDSISGNVDKGSLGEAEQEYMQLWNVLGQQKLKWNRELYDQMNSLSRKMSASVQQAYDEMKRKSDQVYALISRAKSALSEGKKDMPMKLYADIQQTVNSIPNVFFEEKRTIQEQVIMLYRELVSITDNDLSKRVSGLVTEITQLINAADSSIRSGRIDEASQGYLKCVGLFNQIPEGFLKSKNSLGMRLIDIYRTLSVYSEIFELQKQLGPALQPRIPSLPRPRVYGSQAAGPAPSNSARFLKQRHSYKLSAGRTAKKTEKTREKPEKSENVHSSKESQTKESSSEETIMHQKREHAKRNIKKGFLNEAWKDLDEVLEIDSSDVEAKALRAKIKTLQ